MRFVHEDFYFYLRTFQDLILNLPNTTHDCLHEDKQIQSSTRCKAQINHPNRVIAWLTAPKLCPMGVTGWRALVGLVLLVLPAGTSLLLHGGYGVAHFRGSMVRSRWEGLGNPVADCGRRLDHGLDMKTYLGQK